ncbi:N-acetyl-gamma-glutamyl-phosphate reductase [Aliidongia dinghuensis]|uniref:N-acetyl-gamma-glutamyl-phosphate reductase n=1 Tax=Aliidongia dinghuensis TaxID=1867774 RepID=A0A8J3E643_9PROT|nr:N-acetyl-gamma-glutamyl-phosphate reductase [Aliidongia dinghuensis]GGF37912.1 N-acetyl-gamma-glutamyl-phosphate reductase [Aliidongia dinghuensis]
MTTRPTVFIDGEAGTTGLEIHRRLAGRTDIEIVSLPADSRKDPAARRRVLNEVDLAILCLPDDASREAAAMAEGGPTRLLDASTAFRTHPDWVYGFAELAPGHAERIAAAKRVSNPGCYPTGGIALLRPLVEAQVLGDDYPVSVHATSGYSGGGKKLIESYESNPPGEDASALRYYGLNLEHKHVPELQVHSRLAHRPIFLPSVGAWRQGMLVAIPLHLRALAKPVAGPDLHRILDDYYRGQRLVRVLPYVETSKGSLGHLDIEVLNGTDMLELFVFAHPGHGQATLVARLDNLGKGASGAAVQNMDLMLGLARA